jgi:hypothetical protein
MNIGKYDDAVLDCGVAGHDLDCVCDVIITEATPVRYGTDDHWVLSMIAKYFEIDFVESRESLGFLLEKSEEFLTVHLEKRDVLPPTVLYKNTREKSERIVAERQGCLKPSDLQDILGLHGDKFLEHMTFGKPRGMTVERMDKIVSMRQSGMSHYKMCNILGIKNKNKQMGLAGWLSRTFVDPYYVKVKK